MKKVVVKDDDTIYKDETKEEGLVRNVKEAIDILNELLDLTKIEHINIGFNIDIVNDENLTGSIIESIEIVEAKKTIQYVSQ